MKTRTLSVFVLPGANGRAPDLGKLFMDAGDGMRFEVIGYPGWPHYVSDGYTPTKLITDLADQIECRLHQGPACIIGISIGGHLGYAVAHALEERGQKIAGFCAIDTFMTSSAAPDRGWIGRATAQGASLITKWQPSELARFVRSRFCRALLRAAGDRLPIILRRIRPSGLASMVIGFDPLVVEELNMRLLIRHVNPWVPSLDAAPLSMKAATALLRTRSNAKDDDAWRRRCPDLNIFEVSGGHHSLFDEGNVSSLRIAFRAARRAWFPEAEIVTEAGLTKQSTIAA
jgi:thioesterase domain-containing protein